MSVIPTDERELINGKYAIGDLVDLEQMRRIFTRFADAAGITVCLVDHPGGNVLISSGWRDICAGFHRGNPESEALCRESNRRLLGRLDEPGKAVVERCPHGLVDCAAPVFIMGTRIATLMVGQLLPEKPDSERFRRQARAFGYDEAAYLAAVEDIPVLSEEKLTTITSLLGEIALVVSRAGYASLIVKEESESLAGEIAERSQAETALRENEAKLQAIFATVGTGIFIIDKETQVIVEANKAALEMVGLPKEKVVGRICHTLVCPAQAGRCPVKHLGQSIDNSERKLIHAKGHLKDILKTVYPLTIAQKEYYVESFIDITDRKRAEEELLETRRRLTDIVDFLPDATLVVDGEGRVIAWNRAMETMTGVRAEAMLGKGGYEYAVPFFGEKVPMLVDRALHPEKRLETRYTGIQRIGDRLFGETIVAGRSGDGLHLAATASILRDTSGAIVAAIECLRDTTERKILEERLHRAEKMEGLGRLAGGVAHDLNNVLGVLVGHAELLAGKVPPEGPLHRHAANILQSGMRGAAIIEDLLTLARRGVTVAEAVSLNDVVCEYLRAPEFEKLESHHPEVTIRAELAEELLHIKGSPVHLGKTVMNLVSNAAEAIAGRGEVTIRTENRYLDRPIRGFEEMQEGDYVILTVADSGEGIPARDLRKIFEPFYTKKVMGHSGTGLGLAVVWGTVKDHSGYIDVASEQGRGTTFTLYFPATREEPARKEEAAPPPAAYMGRGETVLVVDDVTEQRELACMMLSQLGYRTEAASGGEEAVERLRKKQADLVVLDMIMDPGIDGYETYRRMLEVQPGQRAIIVSGFAETDRVKKAQMIGAGAFVRKPYILERIGMAVRRELEKPR